MKNKGKGLIIATIIGVGVGLVIRNVLKENSVDDIKEGVKENIHKATEVIKENIGEYKRENASNVKIKL